MYLETTETHLLWNKESDPAKQHLWKGHRESQQSSARAAPWHHQHHCCNKRNTAATSVRAHWTERGMPSAFGGDEAVADTLEPRPWLWSTGDVGKVFVVCECCQVCKSSHLSSLAQALCMLCVSSLLTVNLWCSPVWGNRRLQTSFKRWHWAGAGVLLLNVCLKGRDQFDQSLHSCC